MKINIKTPEELFAETNELLIQGCIDVVLQKLKLQMDKNKRRIMCYRQDFPSQNTSILKKCKKELEKSGWKVKVMPDCDPFWEVSW